MDLRSDTTTYNNMGWNCLAPLIQIGGFMKSLKQYLMDKYNCSDDIDDLWDTFEWRGEIVYEGDYDEHRWYTNSTRVNKFIIDNVERFFEYTYCNPKSESNDRYDCGWEKPDLDDLDEVFPKQVTTTIYVTQDKI